MIERKRPLFFALNIFASLLIALGFYLILAWASFNYLDTSYSTVNSADKVSNLAGFIGAWLMDFFYTFLGFGGNIIPFLCFILATNIFTYSEDKSNIYLSTIRWIVGLSLFFIGFTVFNTNIPFWNPYADFYTNGGIAGKIFNQILISILGSSTLVTILSILATALGFWLCNGVSLVKTLYSFYCWTIFKDKFIKDEDAEDAMEQSFWQRVKQRMQERKAQKAEAKALKEPSLSDEQHSSQVSPNITPAISGAISTKAQASEEPWFEESVETTPNIIPASKTIQEPNIIISSTMRTVESKPTETAQDLSQTTSNTEEIKAINTIEKLEPRNSQACFTPAKDMEEPKSMPRTETMNTIEFASEITIDPTVEPMVPEAKPATPAKPNKLSALKNLFTRKANTQTTETTEVNNTIETIEEVENIETLVEALVPAKTPAIETIESIENIEIVESTKIIETTIDPMEKMSTVEPMETVETVENIETLPIAEIIEETPQTPLATKNRATPAIEDRANIENSISSENTIDNTMESMAETTIETPEPSASQTSKFAEVNQTTQKAKTSLAGLLLNLQTGKAHALRLAEKVNRQIKHLIVPYDLPSYEELSNPQKDTESAKGKSVTKPRVDNSNDQSKLFDHMSLFFDEFENKDKDNANSELEPTTSTTSNTVNNQTQNTITNTIQDISQNTILDLDSMHELDSKLNPPSNPIATNANMTNSNINSSAVIKTEAPKVQTTTPSKFDLLNNLSIHSSSNPTYNSPTPSLQTESAKEELAVQDEKTNLNNKETKLELENSTLKTEENLELNNSDPENNCTNSLIHPALQRKVDLPTKPTTPLPSLELLDKHSQSIGSVNTTYLKETSQRLEDLLSDFNIKATVKDILVGPVVTRFDIALPAGVKASKVTNIESDLARALLLPAIRVAEVIPGKPYVGIETPNLERQTVYLRNVLDSSVFREAKSPLSMALGQDISGNPVVVDLAEMPHLLVAGATGSGKSVGVNTMILSLLFKVKPEEVKFIMIDPKVVELSVYNGIPHLLTEVVTDMKKASNALRWCVDEMERRYQLLASLSVRNIEGYNNLIEKYKALGNPIPNPLWKPGDTMDKMPPALEKLPYIVVIVDEFADLMMMVGKQVEELIARLAQKARAIGIHLILATQRPSVDVITGLIKANIPTRIAFAVASKIDSRTILDQAGAESLLGKGDMLYAGKNSLELMRVHGAFMTDEEVSRVAKDWCARGKPNYIDEILNYAEESETSSAGKAHDSDMDALFDEVAEFVITTGTTSISALQRKFKIGFNRAARIMEQLEQAGIVSAPVNGKREILARNDA